MRIKAQAKINLYLDVLAKRDDGYHDLDMVMLPLQLHDTIQIEKLLYGKDTYITCDHVDLQETKYNLITLTIAEMRKRYGIKDNLDVTVHKEIPISGGLGGGSSNCAATIKALEGLYNLNLSAEEELNLAVSLGADVPFCLLNTPAHVEGIGEKVSPIKVKKPFYVILMKPSQGLSTKRVFEASDKKPLYHGNVQDVIKALENGDDELLEKSLFNSLELTSIELVPEIQEIKDMLKKDGFKLVLMSGSGSTVFALTRDHRFAKRKAREYENKNYNVILTKTC